MESIIAQLQNKTIQYLKAKTTLNRSSPASVIVIIIVLITET